MHPNKVKKYFYFVICAVVVSYMSGLFLYILEEDYSKDFKYPFDVDINLLVNQLRQKEVPDVAPINTYNYDYIYSCSQKCKLEDPLYTQGIRLVYLIKSAPHNNNKRLAIRNSWGFERRFSDVEIKTVFLLGITSNEILQRKIKEESSTFNDIIQANYIDSYFNNTVKTMMGFKWAITYCNESKFYMFVDDDYYVSTKNVLRFVRNPANYPQYLKEYLQTLPKVKLPFIRRKRQNINFELPEDVKLYAGYVIVSKPQRFITSKWYVSLEEYPYNKWPPYVTAGAYVLSREALLQMYYASFYTKHFRFDDIYLALVAKKVDIEPFHCDEFHFYRKKYEPKEYQYTIASHGFNNPEELLQIWTNQKSLGNA
ncbi:beta-1,3-galactosyltransferase brn-like [Agrilus planipennis]|uniref:Hexosyltransferase n=1 Tax=Agrilus planipennis TaxID=224129 RepID=A0A1W4WGH9_AGRPL|nr:beta-1,3-galactosyltransferase brn [Agrilus planipennis]XP_025829420.1 beta-1,3-galactosyltransferase brn-like [Agrilus planipennis]